MVERPNEDLDEGMRLIGEGRRRDGIERLRRGLDANPEWAECWYYLGHAYLDLGMRDEAAVAFETFLATEDAWFREQTDGKGTWVFMNRMFDEWHNLVHDAEYRLERLGRR